MNLDHQSQPRPDEAFWMQSTARSVSLIVKARLLFGYAGWMVCWGLFAFTMSIFWVFISQVDFTTMYFWDHVKVAPGFITNVSDTGRREGGAYRSGAGSDPVMAYAHTFTASDGHPYHGELARREVGIQEGNRIIERSGFKKGDRINVEYLSKSPTRSRIQFPTIPASKIVTAAIPNLLASLVALAFSAVFIYVTFVVFKFSRKNIRLLELGQIACGELKSKSMKTNGSSGQWKLVFEFQTNSGGTQSLETAASTGSVFLNQPHQEILYNPADPPDAVLLAVIPGKPTLDHDGTVRVKYPALSIVGIAFTMGVLLLHSVWAWKVFRWH